MRALVTTRIIDDYLKIMMIFWYWFWHSRLGSRLDLEEKGLIQSTDVMVIFASDKSLYTNMSHFDELQTLCFDITKNFQKFKNNCNKE